MFIIFRRWRTQAGFRLLFVREPTNHKCEIILNFNIYDCPFLKEKGCDPQKGEWGRIWIQIFMKNIFCWLKANFLVEEYGIKHLYLILFGQMATAFFHSIILEFSFFLVLNENLFFFKFCFIKNAKTKNINFLVLDYWYDNKKNNLKSPLVSYTPFTVSITILNRAEYKLTII